MGTYEPGLIPHLSGEGCWLGSLGTSWHVVLKPVQKTYCHHWWQQSGKPQFLWCTQVSLLLRWILAQGTGSSLNSPTNLETNLKIIGWSPEKFQELFSSIGRYKVKKVHRKPCLSLGVLQPHLAGSFPWRWGSVPYTCHRLREGGLWKLGISNACL